MPAKVSESDRAMVTAGFEDREDDAEGREFRSPDSPALSFPSTARLSLPAGVRVFGGRQSWRGCHRGGAPRFSGPRRTTPRPGLPDRATHGFHRVRIPALAHGG